MKNTGMKGYTLFPLLFLIRNRHPLSLAPVNLSLVTMCAVPESVKGAVRVRCFLKIPFCLSVGSGCIASPQMQKKISLPPKIAWRGGLTGKQMSKCFSMEIRFWFYCQCPALHSLLVFQVVMWWKAKCLILTMSSSHLNGDGKPVCASWTCWNPWNHLATRGVDCQVSDSVASVLTVQTSTRWCNEFTPFLPPRGLMISYINMLQHDIDVGV